MEVKAKLNGIRIAPRKVRLVAGLIKKKDIDAALDQLAHMSKRSAAPIVKLVNSAVANAENNYRMVRGNLFIKNLWVDEGIKLRRWQPKGFGRAGEIQKKTSRINLILDERVAGMRMQEGPAKKKAAESTDAQAEAGHDHDHDHEPAAVRKGPAVTDEAKPKSRGLAGFGRRLFQRKSG
ncbi:MAG TPA: 50S ribosomal protein L22 [Candidatus Paceibacterota bacterium]|nr:50S ribosomal protein L22 [Candidatus Paceibacterota bacterium]